MQPKGLPQTKFGGRRRCDLRRARRGGSRESQGYQQQTSALTKARPPDLCLPLKSLPLRLEMLDFRWVGGRVGGWVGGSTPAIASKVPIRPEAQHLHPVAAAFGGPRPCAGRIWWPRLPPGGTKASLGFYSQFLACFFSFFCLVLFILSRGLQETKLFATMQRVVKFTHWCTLRSAERAFSVRASYVQKGLAHVWRTALGVCQEPPSLDCHFTI